MFFWQNVRQEYRKSSEVKATPNKFNSSRSKNSEKVPKKESSSKRIEISSSTDSPQNAQSATNLRKEPDIDQPKVWNTDCTKESVYENTELICKYKYSFLIKIFVLLGVFFNYYL